MLSRVGFVLRVPFPNAWNVACGKLCGGLETRLKLTMVCSGSGGYPCLKGKVHAIKHLGFILRDLFYEWHDPTDGFQKGVLCAFASSCRSEEILPLYRSDFKLPRPIAEEVRNLCWAHVRQTKELMNYSDRKIFNVTFKHHWLLHAGHRARFQTPVWAVASRVKTLCSKYAR